MGFLSTPYFRGRPRPELVFDNFPRQTGHWYTLGGLGALNVGVFALWQHAAEEPDLNAAMEQIFLWRNTSVRDGEWWTILTPSFSHVDFGHLSGNMLLFLYLGKRIHELIGRSRTVALYLLGAAAGTVATEAVGPYSEEDTARSIFRYINIMQVGAHRSPPLWCARPARDGWQGTSGPAPCQETRQAQAMWRARSRRCACRPVCAWIPSHGAAVAMAGCRASPSGSACRSVRRTR